MSDINKELQKAMEVDCINKALGKYCKAIKNILDHKLIALTIIDGYIITAAFKNDLICHFDVSLDFENDVPVEWVAEKIEHDAKKIILNQYFIGCE